MRKYGGIVIKIHCQVNDLQQYLHYHIVIGLSIVLVYRNANRTDIVISKGNDNTTNIVIQDKNWQYFRYCHTEWRRQSFRIVSFSIVIVRSMCEHHNYCHIQSHQLTADQILNLTICNQVFPLGHVEQLLKMQRQWLTILWLVQVLRLQ